MKKLLNKKNFYMAIALFVLILFAYITYKTPLAGDDWGYALNGMANTPIKTALAFYQSWSGRFFSELWGMIVPCRKWLWNIINPLLFFIIFISIYKLTYVRNKYITIPLLILAMMLSIEDNLRMETYSWIMGTTYIIPLCFSLLYFLSVERLFETDLYDNKLKTICYIDNVLLFIIGLMMENIAATMIVAIVLLIIYAYITKRKALKFLIINLIVSIISFVIMRLSPGSSARLISEHASWASMNLFEKLSSAYSNFLSITFINNRYAISLFSLIMILLLITTKKDISKTYKVIAIIFNILAIVNVFSALFINNFLNINNSIYSMIYWPLYVINSFITLFSCLEDSFRKDKTIFMLVVAGCSALVMLYSPIYGSRSAIYLVYYLIVVSSMLLEDIKINKKRIEIIIFIGLCAIIVDRSHEYIYKYKLVGLAQSERLEIIQYYKDNPDVEEAWIPRFPVLTVHGADIEEGDTYHFETFKEYYGLPQAADKIVFYWKDSD